MFRRRYSLWLVLLLLCCFGCQCSNPAATPLPWQGPSCFSPPPNCTSKLLCQNGVWQCISCIDGETRPCYEGNRSTIDVGTCKQGSSTCSFGTWGACINQIVPNEKDACGDGKDDNCDGQIDEGCDCDPNGPDKACGLNVGECRMGTQRCGSDGKWQACVGNIKPTGELCNNKDDDCDGQTDENFLEATLKDRGLRKPCEVGVGACKATGVYVCSPDGQNIVCSVTPHNPTPEECDGIDNDCDGDIDENYPQKGQPCSNNKNGVCAAKGKYVCKNDGSGVRCNANNPKPGTEVCNGKDDDCDGSVDEDIPPTPCTISGENGVCAEGLEECSQGKATCISQNQKSDEKCNGKDDNCDGQTDEDFDEKGDDCSVPNANEPCDEGTKQCKNGKVECEPKPSSQSKETKCDGKDDDCNGKIDDNLYQNCDPPGGCKDGYKRCNSGQWSECRKKNSCP